MALPLAATSGTVALARMFGFLKKNKVALIATGAAVGLQEILDDSDKEQELDALIGRDTNLSSEQKDFIKNLAKFVANEEAVLWASDREGKPIPPNYLIIDTNGGKAWFARNYYNKKYVKAVRSGTKEWAEDKQLKQLVNKAYSGK